MSRLRRFHGFIIDLDCEPAFSGQYFKDNFEGMDIESPDNKASEKAKEILLNLAEAAIDLDKGETMEDFENLLRIAYQGERW